MTVLPIGWVTLVFGLSVCTVVSCLSIVSARDVVSRACELVSVSFGGARRSAFCASEVAADEEHFVTWLDDVVAAVAFVG